MKCEFCGLDSYRSVCESCSDNIKNKLQKVDANAFREIRTTVLSGVKIEAVGFRCLEDYIKDVIDRVEKETKKICRD